MGEDMVRDWVPTGPPVIMPEAKFMENAEPCRTCGALVSVWYREQHREFHKNLELITEAQERLNRATRGFVKIR